MPLLEIDRESMRNQKNGQKYVSKFYKQDAEDAAGEQKKQMNAVGKEEVCKQGVSIDLKQFKMLITRESPAKGESTESNSSPMSTFATKT